MFWCSDPPCGEWIVEHHPEMVAGPDICRHQARCNKPDDTGSRRWQYQASGWGSLASFGEIEVVGYDDGGTLVAFGDQLMGQLIHRCHQRLEAEIVEDQQECLNQLAEHPG